MKIMYILKHSYILDMLVFCAIGIPKVFTSKNKNQSHAFFRLAF